MTDVSRCYSIDDLNKQARKSIPEVLFDYLDGGAEDEITVRRNRESFACYEFVPRVLEDVRTIDLSVTMQGVRSPMPLFLAPTGMTRLFHYQGEEAVARAADETRIPLPRVAVWPVCRSRPAR